MVPMLSRRNMLAAFVLSTPAIILSRAAASASTATEVEQRLAALNEKCGGRLGVAALDSGSGARFGHRADERFAMCSTFKFLAAGAGLARVDRGEEQLDRRVVFTEGDLVGGAITKDRVGMPGMTIAELCAAAITLSDNTAGNLLLKDIGGPEGLTAFIRSIGDPMTRLDRNEPTLNEAAPGDVRDTTTPNAMVQDMRTLLLGDKLSAASKDQLAAWLVATKTGGARLRAGLPKDWRVGDKTGTGDHATANDIAVIWPTGHAPLLVTSYFTESQLSDEERNAVHAEVGKIIAGAVT